MNAVAWAVIALAGAALGWLVGTKLAGRRKARREESVGGYGLVGVLGSGSTSTVYLGRAPGGDHVAVKVFHRLDAEDPATLRRRVDREVAALRSIQSPHVPALLDVVHTDTATAVVTEYVNGATLTTVLGRHRHLSGPQACVVLEGALLGLAEMHAASFVHRDVKPDNIVVTPKGESRLVDFGLAVPVDPCRHGEIAGSPAYMSPEQAAGEAVDARSDVWSCAAVLFEMLHGARLVTARPPSAAGTTAHAKMVLDGDAIPPDLSELTARALATEATERPVDAADLLAQLRECAGREYGPDWRLGVGLGALVAAVGLRAVQSIGGSPSALSGSGHAAARTTARVPLATSAISAGVGLLLVGGATAPLVLSHTASQRPAATQSATPARTTSTPTPSGSLSPSPSPDIAPTPLDLAALVITKLLPGAGGTGKAPVSRASLAQGLSPVLNMAALDREQLVGARSVFSGNFSGQTAYVYLIQLGSREQAVQWLHDSAAAAALPGFAASGIPGATGVVSKNTDWIRFARGPLVAVVGASGPGARRQVQSLATAQYGRLAGRIPA